MLNASVLTSLLESWIKASADREGADHHVDCSQHGESGQVNAEESGARVAPYDIVPALVQEEETVL